MLRAIEWYEARDSGLGARLFAAMDAAMRDVAEMPERFPVHHKQAGLRRAVVKHFAYVLIYRVLEDGPQVVAVAHTSRRPGYWLDRVK